MRLGTPSAFVVAQHQLQDATILEEAVRDPVVRVRLAIERSALDVDVLIAAIKVDVPPDRGRLASKTIGDINLREERRYDEVYVRPPIGHVPIMASVLHDPMAPESSFPGIWISGAARLATRGRLVPGINSHRRWYC